MFTLILFLSLLTGLLGLVGWDPAHKTPTGTANPVRHPFNPEA